MLANTLLFPKTEQHRIHHSAVYYCRGAAGDTQSQALSAPHIKTPRPRTVSHSPFPFGRKQVAPWAAQQWTRFASTIHGRVVASSIWRSLQSYSREAEEANARELLRYLLAQRESH